MSGRVGEAMSRRVGEAMSERAGRRRPGLLRVALAVGSLGIAATLPAGCADRPADHPPAASGEVTTLPGVDTHDLTPREQHEFSRYVAQLPAPCPSVAVPVGQCVTEKRDCKACGPAAQAIAEGVREGMAAEQIEGMYKERFSAAGVKTIPLEGSPSRGPETAAVTIVEFADFECPFCQRIAPELDALWEKRQTQVRFVYKFMPLSMHPHSEIAARAAVAAQAQGKFWPMHHALFAAGGRLDQSDLDGYAKANGLDLDRFHADMQSAATTARLKADRQLADDLGVQGTPTIYVDGREFDSKADLGAWVDSEIAARGQGAAK